MSELWVMFKEAAGTYGLFFAMFLSLLIWVLWTNDKRERRYIEREDRLLQREDQLIAVINTLGQEVNDRLSSIEMVLRIENRRER